MTREVRHEAQFSREIIDAFTGLLPIGTRVHDPMAGTGERLGRLADSLGLIFTGTELEPSFIVDPRVRPGDATDRSAYPSGTHVIVTSPAYPNGMADHFAARDPSRRHTYRAWVAANEGADRELHPHNLGRWGYRGRGDDSYARARYWQLADDVVRTWTATRAIVNVKDFLATHRDGYRVREPVVDQWAEMLERHGYRVHDRVRVGTPGQRDGANRDRVEAEEILDARLPAYVASNAPVFTGRLF